MYQQNKGTMLKYCNNWGGLTPENKAFFDDKYERFVPWSGHANTLGGEIIRAINRICYRFYNDGDTVARYYGCDANLSWACDNFLSEKVPGYETMQDIDCDDERFEEALCKNFNHIAEYLRKNEALFQVENYEDCIANAPIMHYEDEYDDYYETNDDYYEEEEGEYND